MTAWILIIVIGGLSAPDVQITRDLTEAQCKRMAAEVVGVSKVSAACFGPNGEFFNGNE